MSKRAAEAARAAFPYFPSELNTFDHKTVIVDGNAYNRGLYFEGYEQAEKDIIAHIREQVNQWMPEKDGEEYTDGKRLAFNSVLHLLEEIENYG